MLSMLAVAGSVLVGSTASAQFSMPPAASSPSPAPSATSPVADLATSLAQAEKALNENQFLPAVQLYRVIRLQAATASPDQSRRITALRQNLTTRGIDVALLDMPPTLTPTPFSQGVQASPMPADARSQALMMIATGRAALDRGDVARAYQMAQAATNLNIPDHQFAPGDARPWQLMLDAQSAAQRLGLTQEQLSAPGTSLSGANVVPAGATQFGNASPVVQAGGSGAGGSWPGGTWDGQTIQQVQGSSAVDLTEGTKLYQEGMLFLSQGETTKARDKFVEAWKYESTLDVETRRALQSKLTLLQPRKLPGTGSADQPLNPIQQADLEAQAQTRRLYREVTAELAKANEKRESAPLDAVDDLERVVRRIEGSNVDQASKASLTAMVSRALTDQRQYVEANRADIELKLRNEAVKSEMQNENLREARVDQEISSLVESFNDLMDEQRYPEAEIIAKQVGELKPNSSIATSMFHASRTQSRIQIDEAIRADSEDGFAREMLAIGAAAITPNPDKPFSFPEPRTWEEMSTLRLAEGDPDSRMSPKEKEIQRTLKLQEVQLRYQNRPLGEVLDELSAVSGVPIVMDTRALAAVRVTRDTPISQSINTAIPLKSAMNIMLRDLDLAYVIENDVLSVTSRQARQSMLERRTYRVTDLVTPIPNFVSGYGSGLAGALQAAYQMAQPTTEVQIAPVSMADLGGGMGGNRGAMNPNAMGQYNPAGGFASGLGAGSSMRGGAGGGALADFDSLIQLIQTTIEPDSWEALGGTGAMSPYPQNLSLVISTTSDIHDQIVDLLESLRRLQNLQITIEVRFITLADTFFEQIGIDFDVQFDDNASRLPTDDGGPEVTIGLSGPGVPTPDLDIRFENNSAGVISPFGAPDAGAISSIGFAILSDIEAFFFLQAAQGDARSNIMQAPKVTMFDGQIASINDTTQRPFVTSVIPVVGDFAVAQQPVIVVLDEGTRLNVQAVVSDDKRFVRVTLVPTFSQIGSVDTFTFQGSSSSRSSSRNQQLDTNGDGVIDNEDATDETEDVFNNQGTTVQQPSFAFTSVSTTVSVPDGGTILLGGIKRMSEGRTERGLPFLSKIPYVSRLFRNTAIGRDSRSLMLMVTPRIIIQEEEEIAQTGFDPGR